MPPMNARNEGYETGYEGREVGENPYFPRSVAWKNWLEGWASGQNARENHDIAADHSAERG